MLYSLSDSLMSLQLQQEVLEVKGPSCGHGLGAGTFEILMTKPNTLIKGYP